MKNYTTADVDTTGQYKRLVVNQADTEYTLTMSLRRGYSSGYGRKICTGYTFRYCGRVRRVYVCCFSNSGSTYIVGGGNWNGNLLIDLV